MHAHRDILNLVQTLTWTQTQTHKPLNVSTRTKHSNTLWKHTQKVGLQSRWAPFCVKLKASAKPVPPCHGGVHQPAAPCLRVTRAEHLACSLAVAWIREAQCYHPGTGDTEARLRMTNWLEGASDESVPRNILWRQNCIQRCDKHAILYGQVYKCDSRHVDWSASQRHLNGAKLAHQDNAKVFILERQPKYYWIRELFSAVSGLVASIWIKPLSPFQTISLSSVVFTH